MRGTQSPTQSHAWLYIDFSNDYGATFTTYFHDLDSLYTSVSSLQKAEFGITVSPNPFSSLTNISFELPENYRSGELNIFNLHGQLIRKIKIPVAVKQLQWDGTDQKGMPVPKGIYLLNICNGTYSSNYHKLLFTN
jgi:flagellar hook assembly protein FlgD